MKYLINQALSRAGPDGPRSRVARLLTVVAMLGVLVCCASIPHTGRRQFNVVSDQQLNSLALKAFKEVVKKEPECHDQRLKEIVERVTKRVTNAAEEIDHPGFKWEVRVVDKDEPNAFCLPGGKIVVYSGIAKYARNEAGLAAVIGHEVAHAVARHGGERLSQRLALQGALSVGGELLKKDKGRLDSKARLLLGALGMGGVIGVILPYSRVHEFEADQIGQIYMAAAGYDPTESVRFWDRMSKIKKPPIPIWLSTHPAGKDRIEKLRESLPDAMKYYNDAKVKYGRGSLL